jgi:hypothetical protein
MAENRELYGIATPINELFNKNNTSLFSPSIKTLDALCLLSSVDTQLFTVNTHLW